MIRMQKIFANQINGLDHGIPSYLYSEIGQKIGVGKYLILCVKKSIKICKGHASIVKHICLLSLYVIMINTNAIIMLCEKSYK